MKRGDIIKPSLTVLLCAGMICLVFGGSVGISIGKQAMEAICYKEAEELASMLSRSEKVDSLERVIEFRGHRKLCLVDINGEFIVVVNGGFQLRIGHESTVPEIQPIGTLH